MAITHFNTIKNQLVSSHSGHFISTTAAALKRMIHSRQKERNRGSFKTLCTTCQTKGCCTSFSSPLLFPTDLEKLQTIGKNNEKYVKEVRIRGKWVKSLNKKKDSAECIFWDNSNQKCSIYKNRPFDCMIYPFDIFAIDGKYYWVVYSCNKNSNWKWSESFLQLYENSKEFQEIIENLDSYHSHVASEKSPGSEDSYTVIREVKIHNLLKR
jgi:Fe-S-cluster containining protein